MVKKIKQATWPNFNTSIAILFIVCGLLGLTAAFALTLDKFAVLENPNFQPICNINPVFSCTSVMKSPAAEVFGIPNTLFGIIGYTATIVTGVAILAGATMKRWFWLAFNIGQVGAVLFIHWLFYESVFNLGTICLFCMLSWFSTIPIFWYATVYNFKNRFIRLPARWQLISKYIQQNHREILLVWYVAIICIIMYQFWYYWQTLLP